MQSQAIFFTGKQQVELMPVELPGPKPNEVVVKAVCSLISTGTEGTCFNRAFGPTSTHNEWVKYPFATGYCWVGQVIEIGSDVTKFKVGDRVASRQQHASHHVLDQNDVIPIPDGVSSEDAVWFALAKIAAVGANAAEYRFGSKVAIIGAGPIGQMSTRWAAASLAQHVIVIDPVAKRLEMATKGGATAVIDKPIVDAIPVVEEMLGSLPDIVIDSTGNAQVFVQAQQLPRKFGKLVLLGSAGDPTQQHLTPAVMRNGLTIRGVHDIHNDDQWNNHTYSQFYFELLQRGRFNVDKLIWHRFKPVECQHVYTFMSEHRADTMGLLFDWGEMS
ncbi:MAG: zinc-binding dehydrogenase [Phycisphaeraceae bacterium JB051]